MATKTKLKTRKIYQEIFGKKNFDYTVNSYLDLFQIAEQGFKRHLIWDFIKYFNLTPQKTAALLNTSPKTIYSWKNAKSNFNKETAVQVLALSELFNYGIEVFEDKENFFEWLYEPNKSMGGKQPFEILYAPYGIEKVRDLLMRIDYGVYS